MDKDFEEIMDLLAVLHKAPEESAKWLLTPNAMLLGDSPQDLVNKGKGYAVVDLLERKIFDRLSLEALVEWTEPSDDVYDDL